MNSTSRYTFANGRVPYTLEVESERRYDPNYEIKERIFGREVTHHGKLFTYDESISALQARGFERHLLPGEFSQIFFDTIGRGAGRKSLDGVVKDILNPRKAVTPELQAEFSQKKYKKKNKEYRDAAGYRIIEIREPEEEMPEELHARYMKASEQDHLLKMPEFTAVMLTARAEPARIIAHIEPQNIKYNRVAKKYVPKRGEIKAKEVKEFPLKMRDKWRISGTRIVQGFFGRFVSQGDFLPDPHNRPLPYFHLNASVQSLYKLCPDLVSFLWGQEYSKIEKTARRHRIGKLLLEDSLVMSVENEGDLVPLLIGSVIYGTPLYLIADDTKAHANSRGAMVLT